jgi:peptidoglycan/xylan/chitin deacetylase (PgdA/CDA1 family)
LTAPIAAALVFGSASFWAIPAAQAAPGGMISVTFDDGWTSQSDNALPILNKYAIPATMYIISGSVDDAPTYMTQAQIKAFANRGDEIASHTVTHVDLTAPTTTPAQVTTELSQSKATLQQMFGPSAAIDFASPYGAYNATTTAAVKTYYSTQRNTDEGFNAKAGFDPYNILVQNVVSTTPDATVQGWITSAKTNGTWLVLVYHEVGANIGGDIYNTPTASLDAHMAAVKNSGLALVTVRQGVEALTGTTPPPPPPPTPTDGATAINAVATANPGLGAPTGDIVCGLVSGGCYRNYVAGTVIWSQATGAHSIIGAVRQEWAATGYEGGILGYPTTDQVGGLVSGGVYQNFQRGTIMWSQASGAHYTLGAIRQKWAATGYEGGFLGYPTSSEVGGLINGGVYQNYQRGTILWSPATGAHYVVGAVRQGWAGTGFEGGILGYPTSDEVVGLVNGGVYQNYQRGTMMWSPGSGAHYITGAIRQTWASTGFEGGRLGYPVTNEYASGSGVAQDYQGGRISWSATGGAAVTYK